jgi:tRNA threonylcarbamoyladenosine biosynthesis protein TsaB
MPSPTPPDSAGRQPLAVAFECSSRRPSLAVGDGQRVLERWLSPGVEHASDLLPALDLLLAEMGADPRSLGSVLVGLGPGSYTGLRVGIATAMGLARGTGAALRGLASGEVLAWQELAPGESLVQLLDARQGGIYFAHYARRGEEIEVLRSPCVLAPEELAAALPKEAQVFAEAAIAPLLSEEAAARLRLDRVPGAGSLLDLGRARLARLGPEDPASLEPLYLRSFAARVRKR